MIIKVGADGILLLDQILTKETLKKAASYSLDKGETSISITLYDADGKQLPIKLRKRGKIKKA